MRVITITNDKYLWLMRGFAYLFNIYWSSQQEVLVAGFTPPDFDLPSNFKFHSIAKENYPKEKYSNAMIELLKSIDDEYFVLMLEDYWLTRTFDSSAVRTLEEYCRIDGSIIRMDLRDDRQFCGGAKEAGTWGHYDLVHTPYESQYNFSFQAAIWNRKMLLDVLTPGKDPWELELQTVIPESMKVMGTKQCPLKYANIMNGGKVQEKEWEKIPKEHRDVIESWDA